jgi:hypothetical protein
MPYLTEERQKQLLEYNYQPENGGDLNFLFTNVIRNYLWFHGHSYSRFNDVIGALEGAKLELYRRIIVPYEDQKMEENGDVY